MSTDRAIFGTAAGMPDRSRQEPTRLVEGQNKIKARLTTTGSVLSFSTLLIERLQQQGELLLRGREIQGILFDPGDTLVKPERGSWFPGPNFESMLASHGQAAVEDKLLAPALQQGMRYLNANHLVTTEEEEYEQFKEYSRLVLAELNIEVAESSLAEELAGDMVYNDSKYGLYQDTLPEIKRFYEQGLMLAILSDTWPSLDRVFRNFGIRDYFKVFTISSQVGCCKPDERIYRHTLNAIGLPASQLLFVDNIAENVRKAIELGMHGILIERYGENHQTDLDKITALAELDAYL